jgi:hypothetical protein
VFISKQDLAKKGWVDAVAVVPFIEVESKKEAVDVLYDLTLVSIRVPNGDIYDYNP